VKQSIYSFTLVELRDYLTEKGFAKFAADQIYQWIYKIGERDLDKWTNISKKIRDDFKENLDLTLPTIIWNGLSKDGTRKFLVKMNDQETVEAVAIPARDRLTLCISSQVGCAIGCRFCHTGTMGLKRHLKSNEIVGQFMAVTDWLKDNVGPDERLSNIVYMGQGEPLHNFDNVRTATIIFMEDKGLGLSQRKITLSTSGLVPQIEKLWDFPPVNLAISLHAAHNEIRTELMPINKAFDLERLFNAIKKVPLKAYRRITFEYILIAELNDREEDLEALMNLLDKDKAKINLIPFNEYPDSNYKRPSNAKIIWFQESLLKNGYVCTTRTTKGQDILAACGQLKSEYEKLNLWN
jgi:23S rRNA (adenine2503-C2)-methyltransferase